MIKDATWKTGANVIIGEKGLRKIRNSRTAIGKNAIFLSNSVVYEGVSIGEGLIIGHNAIIREECTIGKNFKLWNSSVVDYGCKIGNNVKVHCNCYIAQYTIIEDNAFIGPGTIIANDKYPGSELSRVDKLEAPTIKKGAQVGVNVTILPGVTIGERAVVGGGSVVTKDVPKETVVYGNPAKVVCSIYDIKDSQGKQIYKKQ